MAQETGVKALPLEKSEATAERLLVLTLALESALKDGNYADAQTLFDERAHVIDLVGQNPPKNMSTLHQVQAINQRIELDMVEKSNRVTEALRKNANGMRAHKAYSPFQPAHATPDSRA